MIKIFTSIGELDLTSVRRLLIAAEEEHLSSIELFEVLNQVSMAGKDTAAEEDESLELARADANRIIEASGWEVNPEAAARSPHPRARRDAAPGLRLRSGLSRRVPGGS